MYNKTNMSRKSKRVKKKQVNEQLSKDKKNRHKARKKASARQEINLEKHNTQ